MIKKIILDLEGKEVKLSVEEAEGLYNALDRIFGGKNFIPYPIYPYMPYYPNPNPYPVYSFPIISYTE